MRLALLVAAAVLLAPGSAQAKVLRYGRNTTFGRLKCNSRRRGMTCRSLASGRGFRVSVHKRELF